MIAAMFVYGGLDAAKHPEGKVDKADRVVTPLTEALGAKVETVTAVRANGIAQILGGVMLAFGAAPRLAAALLAGTLAPTTLAGHRFWELDDPAERAGQQIQFLKNLSMFGGLLLAVVDTEGEPSMSWRAHRAVESLEARISDFAHHHDE